MKRETDILNPRECCKISSKRKVLKITENIKKLEDLK